jgi:hypothetical protein
MVQGKLRRRLMGRGVDLRFSPRRWSRYVFCSIDADAPTGMATAGSTTAIGI